MVKALSMLASHSIGVFTSLIDKMGLDPVLDCLSNANSHIQQPVLTMISMLLSENARSIPEKVTKSSHKYNFKLTKKLII